MKNKKTWQKPKICSQVQINQTLGTVNAGPDGGQFSA